MPVNEFAFYVTTVSIMATFHGRFYKLPLKRTFLTMSEIKGNVTKQQMLASKDKFTEFLKVEGSLGQVYGFPTGMF